MPGALNYVAINRLGMGTDMNLSKPSQEKLLQWLGPRTWHTSHDLDMDRWYAFVDQYQRDHGYNIDETALREHIERLMTDTPNEYMRNAIQERISLAYRILDFLRHTRR